MRRTIEKLHSRSGASILLAMLLLLVATMISSVILSASLTATKRVSDDRTQEQNALYASSAARLFADCLQDSACTISGTRTLQISPVNESDPGFPEESSIEFKGSGPLGALLESGMQSVYNFTGNSTVTLDDISLTFPEGSSIPNARLENLRMQKYISHNDGEGGETSLQECYQITGQVKVNNNEWTIYMTAYIPSLPTEWVSKLAELESGENPYSVEDGVQVDEDNNPVLDEEGNEVPAYKTFEDLVYTKEFKWDVKLSIDGPEGGSD